MKTWRPRCAVEALAVESPAWQARTSFPAGISSTVSSALVFGATRDTARRSTARLPFLRTETVADLPDSAVKMTNKPWICTEQVCRFVSTFWTHNFYLQNCLCSAPLWTSCNLCTCVFIQSRWRGWIIISLKDNHLLLINGNTNRLLMRENGLEPCTNNGCGSRLAVNAKRIVGKYVNKYQIAPETS